MKKSDLLFYKEYLKDRNINGKCILISKVKSSYLIGPLINSNFDEASFYKRIISNSIYSIKIYKKIYMHKALKLIYKYQKKIGDNEIIEVFKNGELVVHKIIKVPGGINEKQ